MSETEISSRKSEQIKHEANNYSFPWKLSSLLLSSYAVGCNSGLASVDFYLQK